VIIYPAIDIIGGQCVRLTRGDYSQKKKYFDDPVKVALKWKEKGAAWIHVVDLDGARTGDASNLGIAGDIKKRTGVNIQYGGGIRDDKTIEKVMAAGIDRAILGTRAIEDWDFLKSAFKKFGDRIIISLDFSNGGIICKRGWQEKTSENIYDFTGRLEKLGMKEVIITDIERDGTLEGADIAKLKNIVESVPLSFIIAGGISDIEDIRKLKGLEKSGISGVITGKALYEGDSPMDLGEAIRAGSDS